MTQPIGWQIATITGIKQETPKVKTFTLELPDWKRHRPGQHYDLRLTASDGYQAQRSYSIASEPEREGEIDLSIELVDDGEISSYMHEVVAPGDRIEVRGPIGGYFVWEAGMADPLLLIAGGSGIVPLMAMIRHRTAVNSTVPVRLLYSSRSPEDVIYFEELMQRRAAEKELEIFYTFTRSQPQGWTGYSRRIDLPMLNEVAGPFIKANPWIFVCGPTSMVELVANNLLQAGLPAGRIKTERFGPTGSSS